MLSFLKLRVVVNNREIYPLLNTEPVIIPVEKDCPRIVITDGFHFTKPVELNFKEPSYFNFNVVCAIDDLHLYTALFFLVLLYLLGFMTGIFIIKALSFVPILWLLFQYYLNRRQFIQIKQAGNH
jgi:hypothetical protein